jgi:hypothetical protein
MLTYCDMTDIYKRYPPNTGVYLGPFPDDTCTYATDPKKESYVLRKLQRGLNVIKTWCERWNI